MKARVKKMAASPRRTRKPVESLQTLKDQTDKYFAIREVAFDIQALWHHIIKVKNFFVSGDRTALPAFDGYLDATFDRWQFIPVKTEEDYLLDIEVGGNLIDEAFIGLARLKHEKRNEPKPGFVVAVSKTSINLPSYLEAHLHLIEKGADL